MKEEGVQLLTNFQQLKQNAIGKRTGRPVVTHKNAARLNHLVTAMLEASAAEAAETTLPDGAEAFSGEK